MAHGDLHAENVMIVDGQIKIIDILYLNSLATVSTETRESKLKRDLISLRLLLQQILVHSEFDPAEATEFNNSLEVDATCEDMREAFIRSFSTENLDREARALDRMFARMTDLYFVEGEAYAAALDEITSISRVLPLLIRIAEEKAYVPKHRHFVQSIWARLGSEQREGFLSQLSGIIDKETPKGNWSPAIGLLWFWETKDGRALQGSYGSDLSR